jgi:hypothetical protein
LVVAAILAFPFASSALTSPTWNLNGTYTIPFTCVSGCPSPPDYPYSVTISTTSDSTGAVTGTGYYIDGGGTPTVTVTGTVTGWDVTLNLMYDDPGLAAYNPFVLVGTIDANGGMSGSASDGQGRTFTWLTTTGSVGLYESCEFGTYAKSVKVWDGFAPATGAIITTPALVATRDYFLEVSGTYFAGGTAVFDIEADAEYSQDAIQRAGALPWTDDVNNYAAYGESLLELLVDGAPVEWGAFNAGHRYTLDVTPSGIPLDISANLYDVFYPNNTGGLCVALYYQDDTGPITSNVAVTPPVVPAGSSVTITATVDDTTTGGSTIKSAEFSFDGGAWAPMLAADGTFDEMVEGVTKVFTVPTHGDSYEICVRGTDDMDNVGAPDCTWVTIFDAYAELSGTAGGPSGHGKSLAFSFDGWTATAGDEILGKADVNYRILGKTCRYTPDANSGLTVLSGIATLTNWHSSCAPGEFNLALWDRNMYPQRGKVMVDGPGSMYDIGLQNLATGNVHVKDLTPGTVNGFFWATDSLYYNGLTPASGLYGNGPIAFWWTNNSVTGGYWNEIVPPTAGTTYYNIIDGTAVVGSTVTLHFTRTLPAPYGPFTFSGSFTGTTLTGQMDGPYLFIATGILVVS